MDKAWVPVESSAGTYALSSVFLHDTRLILPDMLSLFERLRAAITLTQQDNALC